jgi:hypothetical protein
MKGIKGIGGTNWQWWTLEGWGLSTIGAGENL